MANLHTYLTELEYFLAALRRWEVRYGGNLPLSLLHLIDDHLEARILLRQAMAGELDREQLKEALTKLGMPPLELPNFVPRPIGFAKPRKAKSKELDAAQEMEHLHARLNQAQEAVEEVAADLNSLPEAARLGAENLLEDIRQQLAQFQTEVEEIADPSQLSSSFFQELQKKISATQTPLSVFKVRKVHQKNLHRFEEQASVHRTTALTEGIKVKLQIEIQSLEAQLEMVSRKPSSTHTQHLQTIYQRNLHYCRKMLRGELAYVPLNLLERIEGERQAIEKIDNNLAQHQR